MGTNFRELWNNSSFIESRQKTVIDFHVSVMSVLIESRISKGLSQKEFADHIGFEETDIAHYEIMESTYQLNTLLRILHSLGHKLEIVPSDNFDK